MKQTPVAVMGSRKLMDYLSDDTTTSKTESVEGEKVGMKEKKDNNNEVEMDNWGLEKVA